MSESRLLSVSCSLWMGEVMGDTPSVPTEKPRSSIYQNRASGRAIALTQINWQTDEIARSWCDLA